MDESLSEKLGLTLKEKTTAELYLLAYSDSLTGTHNRNMLEELRSQLDCMCLYVSLVDVDNLKSINDLIGHDAGDKILCQIADQLKKRSMAVFRLGGDEFLLIDLQPINLDIQGISYGTVLKTPLNSLRDAIKTADRYMYSQKRDKGRRG